MKSSAKRFDQDFSLKEMEFIKKPDKTVVDRKSKGFDPNIMNAGAYISAPILVGLAIGYFADQFFHTKPALLLLFLVFGTIASFYNIYKLAKNA